MASGQEQRVTAKGTPRSGVAQCHKYENKKPGAAGLLKNKLRSVYFASFAIWCASRETFRLALFL
jgi:hypothetical protein